MSRSAQSKDGPELFSEIIAGAVAAHFADAGVEMPRPAPADGDAHPGPIEELVVVADAVSHAPLHDPEWLLHQTDLLRRPIYRTERVEGGRERTGTYSESTNPEQLPLLRYEYDAETQLLTRIGELNTRDMLVMSVVQQAFFGSGCPADGRVWGDQATFGYIARQLGMHADGATRLIRASLERLATAKVQLKIVPEHAPPGYPVNSRGEVVFGFIAGYGWREASRKGVRTDRSNYVQLDPMLAEMIRRGSFTFLKAEVLRELRDKPLAIKLYAWARTHRPNDRGQLHPYGVMLLANRLGCADTNTTRRRRKVREAVEAVCAAAPDEFPGYEWRDGRTDQVVTLRRRLRARRTAPRIVDIAAR